MDAPFDEEAFALGSVLLLIRLRAVFCADPTADEGADPNAPSRSGKLVLRRIAEYHGEFTRNSRFTAPTSEKASQGRAAEHLSFFSNSVVSG